MRDPAACRSAYLTQVPGSDGNAYLGTNETLNLDLQATVALQPNLKLSFEGMTLTDAFNDQDAGESNRLNVYTHSGQQVFVGPRFDV